MCLDDRLEMRDVQRDGRYCNLNGYMRRGAECAIRMVDISVRVGVNNPDSSADNDQYDAQKGEEQSPRTLWSRF